MGFNFKSAAEEATKGNKSFITEGRAKVESEDLLNTFPEGITINGFDILKGSDSEFAAITFVEDDNLFYFGGTVLTSIIKEWANAYGGDCEAGSDDLKAQGGCKMKLTEEKSKSGRKYIAVAVL